MSDAFFQLPKAKNEPVWSYAPGSPEKAALKAKMAEMKDQVIEIPQTLGGKKILEGEKIAIRPPHEHKHILGYYYKGGTQHVHLAIEAAMAAKPSWEAMPWEERAAIFLKAADLLAGPYRAKMNAATMLGQSKNAYQSEIDAVAEFCDFLRFNAEYMVQIYKEQPQSPALTWNRMEYRALEGFVFAITPFNFTSIAGNLPAAPALMGNTVIWKPAETQIYSAAVIMEIFEAAGLPPGVINLLLVDGPIAGDIIFSHADFAGLHFTGSTKVFQGMWTTIGKNITKYKSYPRIVGETGGKDFILAHPSANPAALAVAMVRGAFEFQGQKCSAASRAYVPRSIWPEVKEKAVAMVKDMKMGSPEDFRNFITAVIDERAFDKITNYIVVARDAKDAEIIAGGKYDKSKGYFIEPTMVEVKDAQHRLMQEEIFGPVLSIYVYEDADFDQMTAIVDSTSPYALTGAIFAQDRGVIHSLSQALRNAAGNFYINDKPTGAVVGQQPFGGARASGTNDKAGSVWNLLRWVSPRAMKENFDPPVDYKYPFMGEE
ncbi:MAG: L-glutamate gamma-semialdehyde dehydrogenase [Haliscomenobacter sp.]|uniref:L-glutamate gamma-semialdehyde dehydrogenase n=1 Tax=Haliscomenobacter sp. TaxID=2717303 RepID=UPI0029A7E037|nr:L-glutamate gamma-semialdehyde dehydrogenase [Haliscomenobacter sp.]MDX2068233.1 L-glutamate gamma-semialdehyde dehydrogenase [Haliscomenobacter sp.]